MTALSDLTGRMRLPELSVGDLMLDLIRQQAPPPSAPLSVFRSWSDLVSAAAASVRRLEAKFAPQLCHFCLGFATIAGQPCPMCDATGLSVQGRQAFRSHHNGE